MREDETQLPSVNEREDSTDGYRVELKRAVLRARDELGGIAVCDSSFSAYVEQLIDPSDSLSSLGKLEIRDLYLAFACLSGDEHALVLFEDEYIPLVRRNISKLNISASAMEEIVQRFRYKLLVRFKEAEPKLAQYNGGSKLSAWLRVVALRQALDFVKARDQKDLALSDAELTEQIVECDQEISLIRKQYQMEFETVLKDILQNLDVKDRNLLRASMLDKLTVDELGRLHKVHKSTAARWLVNIRTKIKDEIKQRLKLSLNLDTYEYDKIAEVLGSQLNLSLSRILKT